MQSVGDTRLVTFYRLGKKKKDSRIYKTRIFEKGVKYLLWFRCFLIPHLSTRGSSAPRYFNNNSRRIIIENNVVSASFAFKSKSRGTFSPFFFWFSLYFPVAPARQEEHCKNPCKNRRYAHTGWPGQSEATRTYELWTCYTAATRIFFFSGRPPHTYHILYGIYNEYKNLIRTRNNKYNSLDPLTHRPMYSGKRPCE